ncbi:MAG: UDP-3-O-(3-hydroxymyristoyl)glucosamine N-acyltransferase [Chthoniobacterales bacterium]
MTLQELADKAGFSIDTSLATLEISGVASLLEAGEGDISFCGGELAYARQLVRCRATAVFVPLDLSADFLKDVGFTPVPVEDPKKVFAEVLEIFAPEPITYSPGIHPAAVVDASATVHPSAHVGAGAVIEAGVSIAEGCVVRSGCYVGHYASIGEQSFLHPQVYVGERCRIGKRVILYPAVILGSDGFGYEFKDGRHQKVPQTGIVQIDDDVEIGSGTTIDRARFGRTWIKEGTKIDNLVQIAHNVVIGEHSIICAQVGISGSTRIGKGVILAGKAGLAGHIEIGDGSTVMAMAGIAKNLPPGSSVMGRPGRPIKEYKVNLALLSNIKKLYQRVSELEKRLEKNTSDA